MRKKGGDIVRQVGRGERANYAGAEIPNEPIKLVEFPIWNKQYEEPEELYTIFFNYYCPIPVGHRTLSRAYQKYMKDAEVGFNEQFKSKSVPHSWTKACTMFRWEDRAKEYWKQKLHDNEAYFEHRLRQLTEKTLLVAEKNIEKALKIAEYPIARETVTKRDENGNPIAITIEPNTNWTHKDAAILAEKSLQATKEIAGGDDVNRMIDKLEALGFRVIDPTLVVESATPVENLLEGENEETVIDVVKPEEPGEVKT